MNSLASSTSSGWVICPPAGTTPRAYSLAARDAAATTRRARARESGACPASGCARQAVTNRRVLDDRTTNTRVNLSEFQSVDRTAIAIAASCVWERDSRIRVTRSSLARRSASPVSATSGRPSGARVTSMSRHPIPRAASLPCSALYTASLAASRTATCSAGSGRERQYSASAGVSRRSNTCAPLSASIARARETSTRSTPTPMALTALEAQLRREPCGSGQIAAEDQAEPDEQDGERRPHHEDRPEEGTPRRDRVDLWCPARMLLFHLGLEREPGGFQPARDGPQGFLPLSVRVLLQNRSVGYAAGRGLQRVERGHERAAAGPEPRDDRALLRVAEQIPAQAAARQPHLPRGTRDFGSERIGDAGTRAAHGILPRSRPGTAPGHVENTRAILTPSLGFARRRRASVPAQLEHPRRQLFTDVVERNPGIEQPARHNDAPERRGELGHAQRHQQFHSARRAGRPVRCSYALTKCGRASGRKRSRPSPVARTAFSIACGSPSISTKTSIAGYHSMRIAAPRRRYSAILRSIRTTTSYRSRSRMRRAASGCATCTSCSSRCL